MKTPPTLTRDETPLYTAWVVALIASLGALFVGEIMGQAPCILCWYQRIAMFPLAVVLGIAAFRGDTEVWRYGTPLALAGGVVAAWHSLLYFGIIPAGIEPCGQGPSCTDANMTLFGVLPLPFLSLVAFAVIAALLIQTGRRHR